MKIRKDFVTNSSSSSFVCEICGASESGWDMGLSEAGMVECVNGHTICEDEIIPPARGTMIQEIEEAIDQGFCFQKSDLPVLSDEELLNVYLSLDDKRCEMPEGCCPICQFIEYSNHDLAKYLEKTYKVSREDVFAKVKEKNKRRKKLYDSEYVTEVCIQHKLNPAEIVVGLKEKFGSYAKFQEFLFG